MPRAKSRCAEPGCDLFAPCPLHRRRPWESSDRRSTLPSDWSRRRAQVLREEPSCQIAYPGQWMTKRGPVQCAGVSTECDHIGDRNDHSRSNLRGACSPCHARRTAEQASAARNF